MLVSPRMPARQFADTRRVRIDVDKAFAEEPPTKPKPVDAPRLMRDAEEREGVTACVSLETVPMLAVGRADLCWNDLSELAAELVLRIDGSSPTVAVVTGTSFTPAQGACELAALVRRGLVRLMSASDDDAPIIEVERVSFVA